MHITYSTRYKYTRSELETHFEESELCLHLYMRQYYVSKLESVLLKIFKCLACETNGNYQLKRHLGMTLIKVTFVN